MQQFNRFYSMCRDGNIGTVFRKWFADRIKDEDGGNEYTKKYFYGIIIIGDPTLYLKPSHYPALTETVTVPTTTTNVSTTSKVETLTSETSTLLTPLRTTSPPESVTTEMTSVQLALGVFATETVLALVTMGLAVVGVFYLRRRGK
jgi:hypothetical protein